MCTDIHVKLLVGVLLLVASMWIAILNGQPLLMADTTAYVRGPDFGVVYFFGNKFATVWTQQHTLEKAAAVIPGSPQQAAEDLNSPFQKRVLGGRSIFYGALLYIGHVTSHFWLSICVQSAIFLYLIFTFLVRCYRTSFAVLVAITMLLLVATPVSFFASFLMPDIFASFLILGTVILVAFWAELAMRDRILISGIILFSCLSHLSHLALLILLGISTSCAAIYFRRKRISVGNIVQPTTLLFVLVSLSVFGEIIFSFAVQRTLDVNPVRPPFVMARLIADGPGYQFLQHNCTSKKYAVCNYLDRLPVPADTFLWSANPKEGVFVTSTQNNRVALAEEQLRFVFDVFRFDPLGVIGSAVKNSFVQLADIGLIEFFPTKSDVDAFKHKLPERYFDGVLNSSLRLNDWIRIPATFWFASIYYVSLCSLVFFAVWSRIKFPTKGLLPQPQWTMIFLVSLSGIVFNAAICGALSGPHPRYQTRISWIPLLIVLVFLAKLLSHLLSTKATYNSLTVP